MTTAEFQIRAWQVDENNIQVMVHSSPAGDIRRPITVLYALHKLDNAHKLFQESKWFLNPDTQRRLVTLGRQLAQVILPRPVYALLTSSLQVLGPQDILRIRLCLDPALIDLPWEYLYRPDMPEGNALTGFLLVDPRLSLVREAPTGVGRLPLHQGQQRMVFAGTLWDGTSDQWGVRDEYQRLTEALASVKALLNLEFITAADNNIDIALLEPADLFHYSGHTDAEAGKGYLLREVKTASQPSSQPKMNSQELAELLQRAKTRLAMFSACNSGQWAFVEPLLRAGLPALIGAQGLVSTQGAYTFSEKLYASLAVGLSLDEAVTSARFHLLKAGGFGGQESLEWGVFMVYMPTTEARLLTRVDEQADVALLRDSASLNTQKAIAAVAERIGPTPHTADEVDQRALRKALVTAFTVEELDILCADIQQDLANDGVQLAVSLDTVGRGSEERQTLNLITYLDRRGYLSYLVNALRRERRGIL